MIYAKFDDNGFPVAFYPSDIYPEQPEGTVEITEAAYQELLTYPGERRYDGAHVIEYVYQPSDDELAARIRATRDALLTATDYLVMPDYPVSEESLIAVKAYRQALRDVTTQETFPQAVTWPLHGGEL